MLWGLDRLDFLDFLPRYSGAPFNVIMACALVAIPVSWLFGPLFYFFFRRNRIDGPVAYIVCGVGTSMLLSLVMPPLIIYALPFGFLIPLLIWLGIYSPLPSFRAKQK